jgi:hypothetical protein
MAYNGSALFNNILSFSSPLLFSLRETLLS